jgi:hypothetical protein
MKISNESSRPLSDQTHLNSKDPLHQANTNQAVNSEKDVFEKQQLAESLENPLHNLNKMSVEKLLAEHKQIAKKVTDIVSDLLNRQGITLEQIKSGNIDKIEIDEIARTEAQKLIGPGGDLSPEKVSDRIVEFAIAAFGSDKNKIDQIKNAIDLGFKEAEKAWGEKLPDITKETYQQIQDKLQAWQEQE